jgi:hypothetical protein
MKKTLEVIHQMRASGVIGKYAIGGAVGATFYLEPTPTFDIDVFIPFAKENSPLISLGPIYEYLAAHGYKPEKEHLLIEGWAVQFLPAEGPLEKEALDQAIQTEVDELPVSVMRAEHLMAMALRIGRPKDFIRLTQFVAEKVYHADTLTAILKRHGLTERWKAFSQKYLSPLPEK